MFALGLVRLEAGVSPVIHIVVLILLKFGKNLFCKKFFY